MEIWQTILTIIGISIALSGSFAVFWTNTRNTVIKTQSDNYDRTISSYKEVIAAQDEKMNILTGEVKELRGLHTDSVKMIGQLQGELKSWKELPIRELADHMSYVTELQYIMAKHLGIDHLPELKTQRVSNR